MMNLTSSTAVVPSRVIQLVRRLDFPRVLGSDGEDRAFEIISDEIEALGIPTAFEGFVAPWTEFGRAFIEVDGKQLPVQPLISPIYSNQWFPVPRSVRVEGTLVDVSTAKGESQSCIALRRWCDRGKPCIPGASAQVFVCPPETDFVAYYLACENPIPSAYVSPECEPLLSRSIGSQCYLSWDSVEVEKTFKNLTAEITGAQLPGDVIVVGAHIDTWPGTVGASDNTAGSALLVEFAKWFVEHPPARTIHFVWFTGEELDRRGSRAYVAAHAYDQDTICLYINVDSGFTVEHGEPQIAVAGGSGVVRMIEDLIARIGWRVRVHESSSASNDTAPFRERGIPTVFVHARLETPGSHPHLPTDRFDKLDADKIRLIGSLSLAIIDAAQQHVLRDVIPQRGESDMAKDNVIVRPVEPGDAEQLRENCFSMNTLAQVQARIADSIQAFERETQVLLVAEVDGVVVGTATLVRNLHPLYAHRGELASLVVHPDYQRRGIARHLVEVLCEYGASMGLEILETGCRGGTPAEAVYPRLGFREYGRLPGGIVEPWGDRQVFDEVSFYMPVERTSGDDR